MRVHCDSEFHKVIDNYSIKQDTPNDMNYAAAKAHVPHAKKQLYHKRTCPGNISQIALHSFNMHFGHISGNRGS